MTATTGPTTYAEKLRWTKFHCHCDHAEGFCYSEEGSKYVPPAKPGDADYVTPEAGADS